MEKIIVQIKTMSELDVMKRITKDLGDNLPIFSMNRPWGARYVDFRYEACGPLEYYISDISDYYGDYQLVTVDQFIKLVCK